MKVQKFWFNNFQGSSDNFRQIDPRLTTLKYIET